MSVMAFRDVHGRLHVFDCRICRDGESVQYLINGDGTAITDSSPEAAFAKLLLNLGADAAPRRGVIRDGGHFFGVSENG
jgi:hypothetical protein